MLPQDVFRSANRKQRYLLLVAVFGLAAVTGVLYVVRNPLYELGTSQPLPSGQPVLISEIIIGTPDIQQGQEISDESKLEQRNEITTAEGLMMRVITTSQVRDSVQVRVRLLTREGRITELDPPSVVFQAGTSNFCCWQVTTPGQYNLQVFRPEGSITSIPLTVRQAPEQPENVNL